MAKIQLVVEIEERYYEIIKNDVERGMDYMPCVLIAKGQPLPKGHGRLIDGDEFDSRIRVAGGMAEEELTELRSEDGGRVMAKIQLVIEIEERLYKNIIDNDKDDEEFEAMDVAFNNAKPLPKGHGDLIDRNDYDKRLESIWKFYHGDETIHDTVDDFDLRFADGVSRAREALNDSPTIIEADKEDSDG